MAKADYTQLAKEVVAAVGGKENIVNVTNCMTRLLLCAEGSIVFRIKIR